MSYVKKIQTADGSFVDIKDSDARNLITSLCGDMATVESSNVATIAYAINDYIIINGILYRVTAAINANGAITVGTNVVKTDMSTELKNMKASLGTQVTYRYDDSTSSLYITTK